MECLSHFESASPERAPCLSRAHLMSSHPPRIIPLLKSAVPNKIHNHRSDCPIIHKSQGLYTRGSTLGHTFQFCLSHHLFSKVHIFIEQPREAFALLAKCHPSCDLFPASGLWGVFVLPRVSGGVLLFFQPPQSSRALLSWLSPEDSTACTPL